MDAHRLITPTTTSEWAVYHTIRRVVLWESRGLIGVYDENHPDEAAPNNHPKLLVHKGEAVGVVRIDVDGSVAALRRVAIRADAQRCGHGRVLLELAQRFAVDAGCIRLVSFVAPDAVAFYQRCGFSIVKEGVTGPSGRESVFMTKSIITTPIGDRTAC